MRRYFFFIGLFLLTISAHASSQEVQDDDRDQWNALIEQVRPAVVKLDVANSIGLDNDFPFSGAATGVIVDKEEGLIVTNRHVVSKSPLNKLSIHFFNSKSVNGKVFYIDPWHDFAFVKFDPRKVDFELTQATLGSIEDISPNEQLMLLGYISGAENSYKYGHVNKLFANLGSGDHSRYSHHIHLTLSRDGGASGSALWNIDGKMVGLHSAGRATESYEVRIDYIQDALEQLQERNTPKRGDIFVQLDTIGLATATGTWGYPEDWAEQGIKENKGIHYALQIKRLIEGTDAANNIQVGDFVLAIKGHDTKDFINIGYSLYTFDKVVDQSVGGYVTLKMYRQGKGKKLEDNIFDVKIKVVDAHQYLPKRFIRFAGAIFHDLTPSILFFYGGAFNDGVFLNSAEEGTTFDALGGRLYKGSKQTEERAMVIKKINNQKIKSLQNFIDLVKEFSNGESFSVVYNDSQDYNPTDQTKALLLSTAVQSPLSIYYWNEDSHMWELDNN